MESFYWNSLKALLFPNGVNMLALFVSHARSEAR